MPMNMVIQEKRRELGLTQEQVAQYLGVTTPAVSKWEKGITCPDIALLPPLARLLKIDLNTLFCFREELTSQEISDFCQKLRAVAENKGISEAFTQAKEMLLTFPHNAQLLQCVTMQLDSMLLLSALSEQEKAGMNETVTDWYEQLAQSVDSKIRSTANFMLASRYIRRGEMEKAQEILDTMPDPNDMVADYADKLTLQVAVYMHGKEPERAARELEHALLSAVNKVQIRLLQLMGAELAAGEREKAEYIAKAAQDMVSLFDLWACTAYNTPLELAAKEQDKEKALPLLQGMLSAAQRPWDMASSPLYHRIAGDSKRAMDKGLLAGMLTQLSQDPQYAFLRDDERFQRILAQCRDAAAADVPNQNM